LPEILAKLVHAHKKIEDLYTTGRLQHHHATQLVEDGLLECVPKVNVLRL